ncbi:MAG: hypothetical protein CL666_05015 [Balneola sp.]|nr:hypothetical protein [Balneola sp.]
MTSSVFNKKIFIAKLLKKAVPNIKGLLKIIVIFLQKDGIFYRMKFGVDSLQVNGGRTAGPTVAGKMSKFLDVSIILNS